ncbi:MAG: TIGR02147 family protein, partial [Bacteriovoracia bacterium]
MAKASSKTHATPVIFGYADYRQYLRDYYQQMKAVRPEFSFRFLAKRGGFASPNFFKLVMEGKRNLSPQGVTKVARALKLSRAESAFFRNLVNFNQSKNTVQKEHHASELLQSEKYKRMHPLNDAQYQYYSQWFLIPIRELVGAPGFREDPAWIARQMYPPFSTEDAINALKDLLARGIL